MDLIKKILAFLLILVLFTYCKKNDPDPDKGKYPIDISKTGDDFSKLENQYGSLNEAIYYSFKDWYLWNNSLPRLDYKSYSDPNILVDSLKNRLDQWSFIADKAENDALFTQGQFTGQGFDFWYDIKYYNEYDRKYKIRVAYVYPESPAGIAGMYRGMTINKVNGYSFEDLLGNETLYNAEFSKSTLEYAITDSLGENKTISITNGVVKIKTVLHNSILNMGSKKVGYLVFNSFLKTSETELTNAFSYFQGQGISELVLDLRYNGGGYVSIAQFLSSMIVGNKVSEDKTFIVEKFNANHSNENYNLKFTNTAIKLDLSRVFIIGSRFTASASELVINGLKPYMNVVLIGEKTHGKPVGFFPFTYKNTEIYPVSFESVNSSGDGKYYEGIAPTIYKVDGLEYQLGDKREYCLKEALYYIENGSSSGTGVNARMGLDDRITFRKVEKQGLHQIRGAF